jgi:hypothetical protein
VKNQPKNKPPGCITLKSGRYYWKIPKSLADRFDGKTFIPLLPPGRERGATKNKRMAESVRLRMWRELDDRPGEPADRGDVVKAFEHHMALGTSQENAKHNAGKIKALEKFAGGRGLAIEDITAQTVEAFFIQLRTEKKRPTPSTTTIRRSRIFPTGETIPDG